MLASLRLASANFLACSAALFLVASWALRIVFFLFKGLELKSYCCVLIVLSPRTLPVLGWRLLLSFLPKELSGLWLVSPGPPSGRGFGPQVRWLAQLGCNGG